MDIRSAGFIGGDHSYSLSLEESSDDESSDSFSLGIRPNHLRDLRSSSELSMTRRRSKSVASDYVEKKLKQRDSEEGEKRAALLHTLSWSSIERPAQRSPPSPSRSFSLKRKLRKPSHDPEGQNAHSQKKGRKLFQKNKNDFPHQLSCPALSVEEWERSAFRRIEKLTVQQPELSPEEVVRDFVTTAVKTTSIIHRIREAQSLQELPFLEAFCEMHHPEEFLSAFRKLAKKESRILTEIMGGKSACSLLKHCLDKKVHHTWLIHVERTRALEEACRMCEERVVDFEPDFDRQYPISKVKFNDVSDSFRSIFTSKNEGVRLFFKINGAFGTMPELKQDSEAKRKQRLMEWLVDRLNQELPVKSSLTSRQQARLLCQGALKEEDKSGLRDQLKKLIGKHGTGGLELILNQLKQDKISLEFCHWVRIKLNGDPVGISENSAPNLLDKFEEEYHLKLLRKYVPCYPILQSISFSAFSMVPMYIRKSLCPDLFTFVRGQPLMKTFPIDDTRYEISIDQQTGEFEATQIKLYRFYQHGETQSKDMILGRVDVYWTVSGHLDAETRKATLALKNLDLDPRESMQSRLAVVQALGITKFDQRNHSLVSS